MKEFQYGFKEFESDSIKYMYICAKNIDSALRLATKYVKEIYDLNARVVSIFEI